MRKVLHLCLGQKSLKYTCKIEGISLKGLKRLWIEDSTICIEDLDYLFSYPYRFRGSQLVFEDCVLLEEVAGYPFPERLEVRRCGWKI